MTASSKAYVWDWGMKLVFSQGHEQTRAFCLSNLHTSILTPVTRDADKRDLFTSQDACSASFWGPHWTETHKCVEWHCDHNNKTLLYCSWCFSVLPFIIVSRRIVESHWKQEIVDKRNVCFVKLDWHHRLPHLHCNDKNLSWTQRQLCVSFFLCFVLERREKEHRTRNTSASEPTN